MNIDYYKLTDLPLFFNVLKSNVKKSNAHLMYALNFALCDLLLNFIEHDKLEFSIVDPTLVYQINSKQFKEFLELMTLEFEHAEFYEGCNLLKYIIPMFDTNDFSELKSNLDMVKKYKSLLDNANKND